MKFITGNFPTHGNFRTEVLSQTEFIHKYISFDALVDIVKNKRFRFTRISSWPDPYECAAYRTIDLYDTDGSKMEIDFDYHKYFGSSWTLQKESDAMWRIYAHQGDGILISTNVMNIKKYVDSGIWGSAVYYGTSPYGPGNDFVFARMAMQNHAASMELSEQEKMSTPLLLKHYAYLHEREVRFIVESNEKNDFIYYDVDPNEFVQHVTLDPRISSEKAEMHVDYLKKIGLTCKIDQSSLYGVNLKGLPRTEIFMATEFVNTRPLPQVQNKGEQKTENPSEK